MALFSKKRKTGSLPARISHYKVLKKLGEGGMGQVYLAEDQTLNRKVAIKILSEKTTGDTNARLRLIKEAKAAAVLDHPNICHVYGAGEDAIGFFMAMQYVEGEPLSDKYREAPLTWRAALDLAIPIADALMEAHAHGIVHRDIKPQNILITAQGQPKLMDFGLAQTTPGFTKVEPGAETVKSLTKTGQVAGSPPYMSPEQIHGETLDGRTDIFSFGCVIYEAISRRHPFSGDGAVQTMTAILTREAQPLAHFAADMPAEFERIVAKCLVKDRQWRYQSFREVLIDLRRLHQQLSSGSVDTGTFQQRGSDSRDGKKIDSIAILPFANTSRDPEMEYLIEGITDNIINSLSRIPKLKVMARTTVFRYKGKEVDAQTVGRDLGTRAVAMGHAALVGDKLIVGVELVDARDGSQMWGEKYNRKFADIFAIQEEISNEIIEKLQLKLGKKEKGRFVNRETGNSDAYQLYLKGRYHWLRREGDDLYKALEYFESASKRDPDYALAYAGVADCYAMLAFSNLLPPTEAIPKAKAAVSRALELDAGLGEAFATLGWMRLVFDWDWQGSENAFTRALELAPKYPMAHYWYAHLLLATGKKSEAMEVMQRAVAFDPASPLLNATLAWFYYLTRNYGDALTHLGKTLGLDPAFPRTHWVFGQVYEQIGRFEEAIASFQKARTLSMGNQTYLVCLGHAYAVAGKNTEARDVLRQLEALSKQRYVSSYDVAEIYVGLGEIDEAFRWLDKSVEERPKFLVDLNIRPNLDPLRGDPRFEKLVQRVGLPKA